MIPRLHFLVGMPVLLPRCHSCFYFVCDVPALFPGGDSSFTPPYVAFLLLFRVCFPGLISYLAFRFYSLDGIPVSIPYLEFRFYSLYGIPDFIS